MVNTRRTLLIQNNLLAVANLLLSSVFRLDKAAQVCRHVSRPSRVSRAASSAFWCQVLRLLKKGPRLVRTELLTVQSITVAVSDLLDGAYENHLIDASVTGGDDYSHVPRRATGALNSAQESVLLEWESMGAIGQACMIREIWRKRTCEHGSGLHAGAAPSPHPPPQPQPPTTPRLPEMVTTKFDVDACS
jgi:hypothetical protein